MLHYCTYKVQGAICLQIQEEAEDMGDLETVFQKYIYGAVVISAVLLMALGVTYLVEANGEFLWKCAKGVLAITAIWMGLSTWGGK